MTTFAAQITEAKCSDLHRAVKSGDDRHLCFTRLSGTWLVCVTDGVSLWRTELDEEEVDALRDLAGINTLEAFFHKFRNGFHNGDLGVAILGNKVTLTVGKGSTVINLDMFEAKAAEKRTEMQNILFKLAESATSLSSELEKSHQLVETLKTQRGGNQSSVLMDLGPKKGPNPGKAKPKKVGMSVINPTSKKRKVAHGVVFD
ncbi:uncharacterized protein LOC128207817 [Mya arenaria]|uniref:uncharacterized protein LOC128207817 n=1 Tax=Mya arenaria TaxID=6604 RepID=UPI0022E3F35A|nr:uncharacterized protein LOC128207817 [Mya arenaria]